MDLYSALPSQSDVRKLLGDSNWYEGPPTFGVLPLDQGRASANVKFTLQVQYLHLGSAEDLGVLYQVFGTTTLATTAMSNVQTNLGTSPSSPQVGDQVLYYGLGNTGAAPFLTHTFVRVGQIVVEIDLTRKDSQASLNELASNARKFVSGLKNLGHARSTATPRPTDARQLPPPGRDITLLGTTHLPIEAFVVMIGAALPDTVNALLHQSKITSFTYGDYVLDADTHMEVQTAFMTVDTSLDALTLAQAFGSNGGTVMPDSLGVYHAYIPTGGSPAAGEYHYVFAQGQFLVLMICKPAVSGEAASIECEAPMDRTARGWTAALQGVG